jgi:hypothetical protein
MTRWVSLFLILFLSVTVSEAWSFVYKWVDENGNSHFTDDPKNVPEEHRGRLERAPSGEKVREPSRKPSVLFEQKTDSSGNNKQWWQKLVKKWEGKKREAEYRIEELQIEIRQTEINSRVMAGAEKEKRRLLRLVQAAQLRKEVAIRMLTEGLPDEARRAGAPLEWLSNKN